jgi:3-(3-hydroxy-phenyl)propionate hydroxylase
MKKYDIIIAGAGPVGLFAANVFGSYGYDVLLLEQHATRVSFPRAIALDSEIIRAAQPIGLADKLLEILKPTGGLQMYSSSGRLMAHIKTVVQDGYHPASLFYQPELETLLEEGTKRYENVHLHSSKLETIKYNGDHVIVGCLNKETGENQLFTGSYLIGCDGANSSVRKALGIEEDNQKYEGAVLKIDAFEKQVKQKDQFFVEQFSSTKLPFIRMVGRNGHRRWEFPLVTEAAPTKEKFENVAMAKTLLTKAGEKNIDNLDFKHVALYRYRSVVQRQWQRGRIFLAGDAAHLMPPFIGQGMCAGFRDIMNLSWKLDEVMRGISPESILDTYQPEREPHYREQLGITIMVGKIYQSAWWYIPGLLSRLPVISGLLKEVKTTLPPIGPGVSVRSPGSGLVFPQCKIMIGGVEMWSDDYIGRHWALISLVPLGREQLAKLESLDIRTFYPGQSLTSHGVMSDWLKKNKATCALVRPDRYVYSTAKNVDQLIAKYTDYKKQKQ